MRLPGIIANNLSLKVVSVVMASLFWLYVMARSEDTVRIQVPVQLSGLAPDLTIMEKPPSFLDMELKGERLSLMTLSRDSLRVVLDMKGVQEGGVSFVDLAKGLIADRRVRVTRVYPAKIEITVARLADKKPAR